MSNKPTGLVLCLVLMFHLVGACSPGTTIPGTQVAPTMPATQAQSTSTEKGDQAMSFQLSSSAFAAGQSIPAQYTCRGKDISPPLSWSEPPRDTKSLALICDDPDAPAGDWVHWILFNLPAGARSLPEGVAADAQLPDGSRQGVNGWRQTGYRGPCPPSGTHRYFFKLYALDAQLNLAAGADKQLLLKAMQGHILAQAELMGTVRK